MHTPCPFASSPSNSFTSKKIAKLDTECEQERIRKRLGSVPTGAAEKRLIRPREARVAAVSVFGHSRARAHRKLKTGRCADVRGEQEIRPKSSAAGSVERGDAAEWTRPAACGKCGKTLKMVKIEGFWTLRRESSRLWICQGIKNAEKMN